MSKAVGTWIFWTRGEGAFARLISRVTGGIWSHVGIGFDLENGSQCYYESLFADGFTGPKPWSKIVAWADENPRRKWARRNIELTPAQSEMKRRVAQANVGRLGYGKVQLVAMWWFERVGRRYGWHVPRSVNRAVCSESVAAILGTDYPLTTPDRPTVDTVTPASAWQVVCRRQESASTRGFGPLNGPRIDCAAQGVSTPAPGGDRHFATTFRRFAQALKKEDKPHAA